MQETTIREPQAETDDVQVTLAELEDEAVLPSEQLHRRRRRKMLFAGGLLLVLLLASSIGAYFLLRGTRVDLRANKRLATQPANGSDIKRAAYESLSDALAQPVAAASPNAPGVNIGSGQTNEIAMAGVPRSSPKPANETSKPVNAPPVQTDIAATLAPPPEFLKTQPSPTPQQAAGQQGNGANANSSANTSAATARANGAQSIRFAALPLDQRAKETATTRTVVANNQAANIATTPALLHVRQATPSFGALLPVRLLGVLYTLRTGALARLELMRDLRNEQWQLKRGTVLVGSVTGGELDRAYVQLKGLIELDTQRFIKLEGELLGSDGGAGLRGKRRRISSPWSKVLDRAAQAGTQIATSVLGRQSSAVIIASDPYGTYRTTAGQDVLASRQDRAFVEVPAGAVGFVLVTALPPAQESEPYLAETNPSSSGELPDDELAELLANADPARIRAALPRMNPELRRAAQGVLKELER